VSKHRFEAVLTKSEGTGTYVVVPLDVPALFGSRRPPVRGTVNEFPFRTTLAPYGDDWYLGFNREVRAGAKVEAGHAVVVELERDDEPREVEVPPDLAEALSSDPAAEATFERFSYSHRKQYVDWIEEAKREETRRRRIEKAVDLLREGKTQR
jgi:Bacteriocin-protection, YdeI or OmpD-Associated/Domain of unknown function (DUF1905)